MSFYGQHAIVQSHGPRPAPGKYDLHLQWKAKVAAATESLKEARSLLEKFVEREEWDKVDRWNKVVKEREAALNAASWEDNHL